MLAAIRLAFRVWRRETASLLGLGPRALQVIGVVLAVIAGGMMFGAAVMFDDLLASVGTTGSEQSITVVRSLGNGVLLSAITVGGIFGVLTADSSAMDTLLHLAGASRAKRLAMLVAPTLAVTVAITWMVTLPVVFTMSAFAGSPAATVGFVVMGALLGAGGAGVAIGIHRLLATAVRRRLRLPLIHANAVAFLAVLGGGAWLCWPTFDPGAASGFPRSVSPGETLASLARWLLEGDRRALLGSVLLLALLATVAALALAASAADTCRVTDQASITYLTVRPPRRGSLLLLTWYELVCLARAPTTLMSFLGVAVAGLAATIWHGGSIGQLLLIVVSATAGAAALHATGVNLPASWLLRVTLGRTWRLGVAKILGALLVVLGLFAVGAAGPIVVFGLPTVAGALVQFTLPTMFGALLAGSLVPVSSDQPLTSAMAGALTLFISGGGSLFLVKVLGLAGLGDAGLGVPVFVLGAGVAVVIVVTTLHSEATVRRA